jgi:hypothetical protein
MAAAIALAVAAATPSAASAYSPFLVVPDPKVAEATPAYRYANMTDAEALAEVDRRGILYQRLDDVPGVRAPIRLTGRLHGVYVHSSLPPEQRVTSPFEILDARLALALDDFCALLERHEIDEITHFTMYRPNVARPPRVPHVVAARPHGRPKGARPRPSAAEGNLPALPSLGKGTIDRKKRHGHAPSGKKQKAGEAPKPAPSAPKHPASAHKHPASAHKHPASAHDHHVTKHARGAPKPVSVKKIAKRDSGLHKTTWAAPGTRHPAGLAIDVGLLHKRDGRWINIARDFHGRIGAKTCGNGAPMPENAQAVELRAIICEAASLGLFTYVLTPDYNAAHADHLHMEIKPGVKWFLTH